MKFKNTKQDVEQWNKFHSKSAINTFDLMYDQIHQAIVSTVDAFSGSIDKNKDFYDNKLKDLRDNERIPQTIINTIDDTIHKFEVETKILKAMANFYLVLLDINTYAYQCFTAKNDWGWRVFARHIFTLVYEHKDAVNPLLNDFINYSKEVCGTQYDFSKLKTEKKAFTKLTKDVASYAKMIRVNVDAHFRGDFEDRLRIIENMSYFEVVQLVYNYWVKVAALQQELTKIYFIVQDNVSNSLQQICTQMESVIKRIQSGEYKPVEM